MNIVSKTVGLAAISIAATTTSTPAAAQERIAYVEVADLNIRSEAGLETLRGRVKSAVEDVCPRAQVRSIQASANMQACREFAIEGAERQIRQLRRGSVKILAIRAERDTIRNQ